MRVSRWFWALAATVSVAVALCAAAPVQALDVPPKPKDIPVVDLTNTLSEDQKQSLAATIAAERKATGNEIGVLMIPSLDGDALEDYSIRVARGWGVGQKDRNSGVLLLVVKNDRKLRIEVGYGLEGALTDARSSQIIRNRITPEFKAGKYYEGISAGLDGIVKAIHDEKDPNLSAEGESKSKGSGIPFEVIFWGILIIPAWLGSILGRTKSWWLGGVIGAIGGVIVGLFMGFLFFGIGAIAILTIVGLLFDRFVSKNFKQKAGNGDSPSWWAGGPWLGGGRNDSGGFGGFGGGSFGGGGSSGSW